LAYLISFIFNATCKIPIYINPPHPINNNRNRS
jgi:hypothetical protein